MDEAKLTQLLGPESARYAINTVQVWQTVDETHVVIDRDRFERLRVIASIFKNNVEPAQANTMLRPGDLDPIP